MKIVDIAGLVKGASKGEGLGNQFLANIRETDAIIHVVRCFDDANVVHVGGAVNPARDVDIIETELLLADLDTIMKRVDRLGRQAKSGQKEAIAPARHEPEGAEFFIRHSSFRFLPKLALLQLRSPVASVRMTSARGDEYRCSTDFEMSNEE